MSTKRELVVKKTTKRKPAAPKPAARTLRDDAVMVVLESPQALKTPSGRMDPDVRRQLVAAEAYYLAERRGFAGGNALEDWVKAEVMVDSRLSKDKVA
jgi:hypothetical protein